MKMSRTQALQHLQTLKQKVKDLTQARQAVISHMKEVEVRIYNKKAVLKVADLRQKIEHSH